MKKYNLSNIMKRAWEIVKTAGFGISEALKKAWKEAKGMAAKLKGTEKQIKWAEDIRKDMREALEEYTQQMKEKGRQHKVERFENFIAKLNEVEDAKFFIDNRMSLFKYEYATVALSRFDVRRVDQEAIKTAVALKKYFGIK